MCLFFVFCFFPCYSSSFCLNLTNKKLVCLSVNKTALFFADSLIYILLGTGAGLLLIFIGIVIFVIRRKQKKVHAMVDMKNNSSTDFSKNFLTICKKEITKVYFYNTSLFLYQAVT